MTRRILPAVLAFALIAAASDAATLCVRPGGGAPCHATIQAAVTAAAAGDQIRIFPGVYYENVVIPAGKDRLRLHAVPPQGAILDGSPYFDRGFAGTGPTFLVLATGTRFEDLRFRNGSVGIDAQAPGTVAERLRFDGTDSAIQVMTPDAVVQVIACEFRSFGAGVILLNAHGSVVRDSRFEGGQSAVEMNDTNGARVTGNRVVGTLLGLRLFGNDVVLRGNDVRYQSIIALQAFGDNPVIENNTVVGAGSGLLGFCLAPSHEMRDALCPRASFSSNRVADTWGAGLDIFATGPGLVVRDNTFVRNSIGMVVGGGGPAFGGSPDTVVERNRVDRSGFVGFAGFNDPSVPCFDVPGSGARLARNVATQCADSGFLVRGSTNFLRENRAVDTAEHGLAVDGAAALIGPVADNVLGENTALANAAQGIAILNGAPRTAVMGNVARQNRTDFCDEGVGTIVAGNDFGTTGPCLRR